jgi:hypothetical protein
MRVVTLSRKPCAASSTTANVVKHEAGALNIDGCRIHYARDEPDSGVNYYRHRDLEMSQNRHNYFRGPDRVMVASPPAGGRWPANLFLVHRASCEVRGTVAGPGYTINRWKDGAKPFGGGAGHEYESEEQPAEQVAVWDCAENCASWALGEQSGVCPTGDVAAYTRKNTEFYMGRQPGMATSLHRGDTGTASRYFKQMKEEDDDMDGMPQEMVDYLATLISPPPSCNPVVIVQMSLKDYPWEEHEDASVHGLITMGNPGPHMQDIDRVLRPGAHLLILSPENEPTGHTGACAVEDFGYEIRDAIAVLDTPGDFHYVAKASSAERNAGVEARTKDNGRVVQNDHETVKPVGIMERLLADIPRGALVVDAFMGSGTTGIACLRTGHDFVGIDQDPQYLQIADQRVRHWDRVKHSWKGATIESEAEFQKEESMGLEDLFGFAAHDEDDDFEIGDCPVCEKRDTEIEIKEKGERLKVCSACAEDREQVRLYLLKEARRRVEELE